MSTSPRGCSQPGLEGQQIVLRDSRGAGLKKLPLQWESSQEAAHLQRLAVPSSFQQATSPHLCAQAETSPHTIPVVLFLVLKDARDGDATQPPLATCLGGPVPQSGVASPSLTELLSGLGGGGGGGGRLPHCPPYISCSSPDSAPSRTFSIKCCALRLT